MDEHRLRVRIVDLTERPFLRFFTASVLGLVLDIALAAALHHVLGLSLITSAAISLLPAASLMYFVHEYWTFRATSAGNFSTVRLTGTLISALVALLTRGTCLYITGQILGFGDRLALLQLAGATGLSFMINYFLVRRIVAR